MGITLRRGSLEQAVSILKLAAYCRRRMRADEVARVEILTSDGTTETLEGTPIHPIWSVDRQDWLPLGELREGEQLQAAGGVAVVLSLTILRRSIPVYNIEVHGEHVY